MIKSNKNVATMLSLWLREFKTKHRHRHKCTGVFETNMGCMGLNPRFSVGCHVLTEDNHISEPGPCVGFGYIL